MVKINSINCITVFRALFAAFVAFCARLILARLVVSNDAKIVIRKLKVVFSLNTIAVVLRVLSKLLVLIKQLGCVAARPAVDAVKLVASTALIAISASTTTIVAIVIQGKSSLLAACAAEPSAENMQRAMASGSLGAPNSIAPHHKTRLTPHLA